MISNGEHVARTCSLRNESCFALAKGLRNVVRGKFRNDNLIHYQQLPVVMTVIFSTITRTQTPNILKPLWQFSKVLLLPLVEMIKLRARLRLTTSQPAYGLRLLIIHIMMR